MTVSPTQPKTTLTGPLRSKNKCMCQNCINCIIWMDRPSANLYDSQFRCFTNHSLSSLPGCNQFLMSHLDSNRLLSNTKYSIFLTGFLQSKRKNLHFKSLCLLLWQLTAWICSEQRDVKSRVWKHFIHVIQEVSERGGSIHTHHRPPHPATYRDENVSPLP